jgi:hypothetical protein
MMRMAQLAKLMGATKNPEVFVLRRVEKNWEVLYSGKIDDNPLIEDKVQRQYLVEELSRVVSGDYRTCRYGTSCGMQYQIEGVVSEAHTTRCERPLR